MKWLLFFFLTSLFVQASPLEKVIQDQKLRKPVSVSYRALLECDGSLADDAFITQVDLTHLRRRLDETYATRQNQLVKRQVDFRERSGELRRLTLDVLPGKRSPTFSAQWRTVIREGETVLWDDPTLKASPSLSEVHLIIAKGVIERDETLSEETKLKGVKVRVRKDLQKVLGIEVFRAGFAKVLRCEEKPSLGAICTCTKK